MSKVYIYILVMATVTYLIRALPLTLIRRHIKSPFIRSFLFYVPFVTLSVMTFPDMILSTSNPIPSSVAFILAICMAWQGMNLITVSATACLAVFVLELFL